MRAVFVASGLGTGGAEFALLRLCKALLERDSVPAVVSLEDEGTVGPALRDAGIPVLSLGLKSLGGWLRLRASLARLRSRHKPDLVQGWMYHGNLAALCFAQSGCPVVWSVRQSLLGNRDKLSTRMVIRASAQLSDRSAAIVYNSAAAKLQHEARGFSQASGSVIPNGFDLDVFRRDPDARARLRLELGLKQDHAVIGHVARFHPSKDHVGFLHAVAAVAGRNPALRAVLAGPGVDSDNRDLVRFISQLGLEGRALLIGSRSDIPGLMSSFDVFCSSSNGMEGFPNVVAEAMSCEVPCVATDVGDARDVVGETGDVIRPNDRGELAAALERMVRRSAAERRELGAAARLHIASRYSIEAVADRYIRLYESLLRGRETSSCAA